MKANEVIAVAANELGYIGKKSNAQLDDKTANITGKYTKYARDLYEAGYYGGKDKNGFDWCCVFMDWIFWIAAEKNVEAATSVKPTNIYGAGVSWVKKEFVSRGRFDTTPKVGDQVIFKEYNTKLKQWVSAHTGLVIDVDASAGKIATIEGNSGNAVKQKSYKLSDSYIDGFCHPYYDEDPSPDPEPLKPGDIGTVKQGAHVYDKNGNDLGYEFSAWVYNSEVIVGEIANGCAHFSTDLTLKAYTGWTACENIIVANPPQPDPGPTPDPDPTPNPEDHTAELAAALNSITERCVEITTQCAGVVNLVKQIRELYGIEE